MSVAQQVLINVSLHETRVAVVADGVLQELQIERNRDASIVGNIYKAKVARVLPDMQAAFIDLGQKTNGFLHVAEAAFSNSGQPSTRAKIEDLLHQGDAIWVQVTRDAIGDKGPRLTMQLNLSSKNLIYRPYAQDVGVSNKITSLKERSRLQAQLRDAMLNYELSGGFIIRTHAETATNQVLAKDVAFLKQSWAELTKAMKAAKFGSSVYQDKCLAMRVISELNSADQQNVQIDSPAIYSQALEFSSRYNADVVEKIALYKDPLPLFDKHSIESQIDSALQHCVSLTSGANIFIEATESMTTIDVNSASNIGQSKLKQGQTAELAYQTNLEASDEIAKQLRLRNLAGIIVVDFIDMKKTEHKKAIINALELALSRDSVKTTIGKVSALGLVELTRQRIRPSLEQILCEDCEVCAGSGKVKTAISVCNDILREIKSEAQKYRASAYTVVASATVIELLRDDYMQRIVELENSMERPISLQLEAHYQQQQYDIVLS